MLSKILCQWQIATKLNVKFTLESLHCKSLHCKSSHCQFVLISRVHSSFTPRIWPEAAECFLLNFLPNSSQIILNLKTILTLKNDDKFRIL